MRSFYEAIGKDVDALARQQKDLFAAHVQEVVRNRAISIIGEECDYDIVTSASRIVTNWHPIDMPQDERQKRQIPFDYTDTTECYTEQQRNGWNREREQYMFDRFNQFIAEKSALIICGSEHVRGLTQLFVDAGHVVTSEDVTKADWFVQPL